jgi:UTP--glucose-1-phosphate uridylyltransferase
MKIQKAVITAAGESHSNLPLQTVVDREGHSRTVLRITLDEIIEAGIEEIAIIIRPGQSEPYISAAGSHASRLVFCEQDNPRGYGDAILRASDFLENQPFLHLVSDHLYVSQTKTSCASQLIEVAQKYECSVSAIQPTRENEVSNFGTVGGSPLAQVDNVYDVTRVIEKPTPTIAEQELVVAGQRAGHYLCMFGMHVLTPSVLALLRQRLDGCDDTIDLSWSLNELSQAERYLAFEVSGSRYDISYKYGLLIAQLAISLSGQDRDLVLTEIIHLLAQR